ncbi:GNAT family N-acetyltransferase [Egicoccus halophilus]|uniref:GNAT family N-acetyltransferase n=1 Tax=Egicoccus halophilus TaxID=1670830 RepID=UPI001031747B|nr:GNAT family N-acetyltransferase [Egicoccus halophilus]
MTASDPGPGMPELRTHAELPQGTLRAEWQQLLDEDPAATLFQGPRYLQAWHEVLGQRVSARVRTLHRDGRLIGVVPEGHERIGTPTGPVEVRRFLGGNEVTDYLGPVSRPEDRGDVALAYLTDLAKDVDWDEFVAGGLAEDSGWPDALRTAADTVGLVVFEEDVEDVCPRVDLTGGYDAYLERLPGKMRHELQRKARKLARDAGELELLEVAEAEVHGSLDAFLDLAAEAQPDKAGFFSRPEMHDWFKALAREFAGDGVFRLHQLQVGGMPGASTVSLVAGGEWGLYNSAFDPALGALAPGIVLVGQLLEVAAEEGCTTFDLLRGDEDYKYRFGAQDRPLRRLTLVRR